jgi:hypothetical protein
VGTSTVIGLHACTGEVQFCTPYGEVRTYTHNVLRRGKTASFRSGVSRQGTRVFGCAPEAATGWLPFSPYAPRQQTCQHFCTANHSPAPPRTWTAATGSNARSRLRRPRTCLIGSRTLTHGCRPRRRRLWAVVCSADGATCLLVGAVMSTVCYRDSSFTTGLTFSFAPGTSITHSAHGPYVPGQCTTRGLHNATYGPAPPRAWSAAVSESASSGQERSNISWGSNFDLLAFRHTLLPRLWLVPLERPTAGLCFALDDPRIRDEP